MKICNGSVNKTGVVYDCERRFGLGVIWIKIEFRKRYYGPTEGGSQK